MALIIALALMTGLQGELRDRILGHRPRTSTSGRPAASRTTTPRCRRADGPGRRRRRARPSWARADRSPTGTASSRSRASIRRSSRTSPTSGARCRRARRRCRDRRGLPGDPDRRASSPDRRSRSRSATRSTLVTPGHACRPSACCPHQAGAGRRNLSLGLQEFDAAWGFVSLDFAERLRRRRSGGDDPAAGRRHQRLAGDRRRVSRRSARRIRAGLERPEPHRSSPRSGLEKMAMSIAIGLIVMVAALKIVASLVLLVMEKSRDIAILKTMGTSPRRISVDLHDAGAIIGLVGTIDRRGRARLALCWVLDRYGWSASRRTSIRSPTSRSSSSRWTLPRSWCRPS